MNKVEIAPESDITDRAEMEYEHVTAELARYDTDSQKIVSFISLLITTAFIVGVEKKIHFIFPIVPIIAIMVIQYLLSNNYAYRVREMYVYKLEDILRQQNGQVPGLYKNQIRKHFQELSKFEVTSQKVRVTHKIFGTKHPECDSSILHETQDAATGHI